MPNQEKKQQGLMKIIKAIHNFTINDDLEKYRRSQANLGRLLGTKQSEASYTEFLIDDIPSEWIRLNRPHQNETIILYCHGGGFFTGSLEYSRTLTTKLASASSSDILSFNYRLAPEHPSPAALEDALKVWGYLMHLGYGAKNVILAGDSAGGNLALSLALKLKEDGRILPKALVLFSPWTDLTLSGASHEKKAALDPILTKDYLERARCAYVPESNSDASIYADPFVSPLYGDYTGFPPVYIQVGTNEILLNDSTDLHKKLLRQDVAAKLTIYKGMWHVFQMSNMKTATEAINEAAQFLFRL